jgi:hypothetical protein
MDPRYVRQGLIVAVDVYTKPSPPDTSYLRGHAATFVPGQIRDFVLWAEVVGMCLLPPRKLPPNWASHPHNDARVFATHIPCNLIFYLTRESF